MQINNITSGLVFGSVKYLSTQNFISDTKYLEKFEIKDIDPEFRKVIENAPLIKRLGEKKDVYVSCSKKKDSNLRTLNINFLDNDGKNNLFNHEEIILTHQSDTPQSFYERIASVFGILTDDFEKFKSDKPVDVIRLHNPEQILTFWHHGQIQRQES